MDRPTPFGVLISQVKQIQRRIIEKSVKNYPIMKELDLNAGQMNILHQLWKQDDITISHLSKRTNLANTTLTNMLHRLQYQGIITKTQNLHNRREFKIQLTQLGKDLQQNHDEIVAQMREIQFKGFTDEEVDNLYDYIERIKSNLENKENEVV